MGGGAHVISYNNITRLQSKGSVLLEKGSYLLDMGIVGAIDKLFQFSQAVGFSQCKDQLCLYI